MEQGGWSWGAELEVWEQPACLGASVSFILVAAVPRARHGAGELGTTPSLRGPGACWPPECSLPQECSGPVPRIRHLVFVCCCAPEVWCYCDRKRERRGEGGWPAVDVPVKSLCPCGALSCKFPQRGESCLCAAKGLPTCETPGPGGWDGSSAQGLQAPAFLLSLGTWGTCGRGALRVMCWVLLTGRGSLGPPF